MRLLVSLFVIFALVIGLGFWTGHSLQTSTDDLVGQLDTMVTAVADEQWETAAKKADNVTSSWAKETKWWPLFLDHQEMSDIEYSLSKVKAYIDTQNSALTLGQLHELKLMLKNIPEKESLSLKNIL